MLLSRREGRLRSCDTSFHLLSKVNLFLLVFLGGLRKPRTPDYEKKLNVSDSWVQR